LAIEIKREKVKLNKGLLNLVFALLVLHPAFSVYGQKEAFDWSKERQNYQYPSTGKSRLPDARPVEMPEMNQEATSSRNRGSAELKIPKGRLRMRKKGGVGGSGNNKPLHKSNHDEKQIEAYRNGQLQPESEVEDASQSENTGENTTIAQEDVLPEQVDVEEPREIPEAKDETMQYEATGFIGKLVLALLLIGLLVWGLYYWFMNRKPVKQQKTTSPSVQNPETFTLSELERMLEQAKLEGNFRGAVRVYFTFILKELITNQWIQWKDDKTNYHYLSELRTRPESSTFSQCVRIYEQVWYGEYPLSQQQFLQIEPLFKGFHQQVSQHS
jgi:hypothetical protein